MRSRVVAVALLIALLAGCAVDPGGALLRLTPIERYQRWRTAITDPLNGYSRAYLTALNGVNVADSDGSLSTTVANQS